VRKIARLTRTVFLEYDLVYALESMHGGVQNPLQISKLKIQIARERSK